MFKRLGVDDLTLVSNPSNSEIADHLAARLDKRLIYTNIGDVLISVNPYTLLPIYGQDYIKMYAASKAQAHETPPHVYQLAEACYSRMVADAWSQAVIISGESGPARPRRPSCC